MVTTADNPLPTSCRQKGPVSDQSRPTPYAQSPPNAAPWWRIHCADSREILTQMPEGSVDCVVTSPPLLATGLRR